MSEDGGSSAPPSPAGPAPDLAAAPPGGGAATADALATGALWVGVATHLFAALSLGWMAWQMARIWWIPAWSAVDLSGYGAQAWIVEAVLLFASMLPIAFFQLGDDLGSKTIVLVLLFGLCGGIVTGTLFFEAPGDPAVNASYVATLALRIAIGFVDGWLIRGDDAAWKARGPRFGASIALFVASTFAGLWIDWPAGAMVRASPGRGIFERAPQAALATMTLYLAGQAAAELLFLRAGLSARRSRRPPALTSRCG